MKTFQQLCPRWYNKLQKKNPEKSSIVDHKRLNIYKERQCVVGEAYGFTDGYTKCGGCIIRAHCMIWDIIRGGEFELIDEFVTHWNQEHETQSS